MSNLLISAFDFAEIFSNFKQYWYLYLALFLFIVVFIVLFILYKDKIRLKLKPTQRICHIALLTAISVTVNVLTYYPVSYICLSFTALVTFISGYFYGAKAGFIVGFMGDFIAGMLFPAGPYNPLIGIANGLMGLIPALIFNNDKGNFYFKAILSFLITLIVCTCGINTLGLWIMYAMGKKSFFTYLFVRLPWQALVSVVNLILAVVLTKTLERILPKSLLGKEKQN